MFSLSLQIYIPSNGPCIVSRCNSQNECVFLCVAKAYIFVEEKEKSKRETWKGEHPQCTSCCESETKWMKPKKWGHKAIRALGEVSGIEFNCFMAFDPFTTMQQCTHNWSKVHQREKKKKGLPRQMITIFNISLFSLCYNYFGCLFALRS